MKLRINLGSQSGRQRDGHGGSNWIEIRVEFLDGLVTRHGIPGTEIWLRNNNVILVEDTEAIAALLKMSNSAGELLFTEMPGGGPPDRDAEENLDKGRNNKVRP